MKSLAETTAIRIETWDARAGIQRIEVMAIYVVGFLLITSGLFHVAVWAVRGGAWEGDVSWRKPILFGVSAGVTMVSMGWVVSKLKPRVGDSIWLTAFSAAMFFEVALITVQQWRGVPSHFNHSTPFDAMVLLGIEGLIAFATLVIADVTWRCFTSLDATSDLRLAIRTGMLFLLLGCALGFLSVAYGNQQQSLGRPPGVYGEAGVMKFVHGMPLHAIQFLPFVVWVLRVLGINEIERKRAVWYVVCALAAFTLFSCVQTFAGRSRFDLELSSALVLAFAFALLAIGLGAPLVSILRRVR